MLGSLLQAVRQTHPLIHCITNYVTINDCANILLAAGPPPSWPTPWRKPPRSLPTARG